MEEVTVIAARDMEHFPFTSSEWAAAEDVARAIVNASVANDDVLGASHFISLCELLADLRVRYGEHPILIETEADFTSNVAERITLYRRAVALAQDYHLPTLSIRLSLAQSLIDAGTKEAAAEVLRACEHELQDRDADDRTTWNRLFDSTFS